MAWEAVESYPPKRGYDAWDSMPAFPPAGSPPRLTKNDFAGVLAGVIVTLAVPRRTGRRWL